MSKLKDEDVQDIYNALVAGTSLRQLASHYGVTNRTIACIARVDTKQAKRLGLVRLDLSAKAGKGVVRLPGGLLEAACGAVAKGGRLGPTAKKFGLSPAYLAMLCKGESIRGKELGLGGEYVGRRLRKDKKTWTYEEDNLLLTFAENFTTKELMAKLPGKTRQAINGRISKFRALGLIGYRTAATRKRAGVERFKNT